MLREGICDTYNGYDLRLILIQDDECFFKNCFSIEKNGEVQKMHVNRTYMVKSVTVMASPES